MCALEERCTHTRVRARLRAQEEMDSQESDSFMADVGVPPETAKMLKLVLDEDGSGVISAQEFHDTLIKLQQVRSSDAPCRCSALTPLLLHAVTALESLVPKL